MQIFVVKSWIRTNRNLPQIWILFRKTLVGKNGPQVVLYSGKCETITDDWVAQQICVGLPLSHWQPLICGEMTLSGNATVDSKETFYSGETVYSVKTVCSKSSITILLVFIYSVILKQFYFSWSCNGTVNSLSFSVTCIQYHYLPTGFTHMTSFRAMWQSCDCPEWN